MGAKLCPMFKNAKFFANDEDGKYTLAVAESMSKLTENYIKYYTIKVQIINFFLRLQQEEFCLSQREKKKRRLMDQLQNISNNNKNASYDEFDKYMSDDCGEVSDIDININIDIIDGIGSNKYDLDSFIKIANEEWKYYNDSKLLPSEKRDFKDNLLFLWSDIEHSQKMPNMRHVALNTACVMTASTATEEMFSDFGNCVTDKSSRYVHYHASMIHFMHDEKW